MKVVAFLPVKGGSERIENKNTKLLDGKPLFLHTLEKLVACDFIDEVYLDSESEEIFNLASDVRCKFFKRDPAFATNKTDGHQLFYNEIKEIEADLYLQILCTSPFIEMDTLRQGVDLLKEKAEYDSVVLVKKEKAYLWQDNQPVYNKKKIPNSVDLPDTIIETMGLYIVRKDVAHKTRMRIGDKPYLLAAKPTEAIDVNFPEDFDLANFIAAGKREKERQLLNNLRNHLTSAMLSDIFDHLGITGIVQGLKPNILGTKIIGRAKTLKLRALRKSEPPEGIYQALYSYHTIIPDDVIVVENEMGEFAYFGELNANLAIRAGAVGAVIGGATRDSREVVDLGFPVFSQGTSCRDVKNRATLESMNKRIHLHGVEVQPGDLIFADNDGVAVIPQKMEQKVLELAFGALNKEKSIVLNIMLGTRPEDIKAKFGDF